MALVVATEGKLTVQLFYLKTRKNKCILSTEMHAHVCNDDAYYVIMSSSYAETSHI